jgi:Tfp pilus assembly protein PilP
MRGVLKGLITGLTLGLTAASAVADSEGGALSGPAAAIAKARAAADTAEHRADTSDRQADQVLGDEGTKPKTNADAATAGSGSGKPSAPDGGEVAETEEAPVATSYDAAAHRDPFRPPQLNPVANARTPLETYQLGQLKLVGVVAQDFGYRAMVEDSAGLGYIITTGTPIGSSGGVVRSIEPRRVVIEESTRDFYGEAKPKEVVMELPQEDRSP